MALALATLVLSLAFRGSLLSDPRIKRLRFWAWIWSLENFCWAWPSFHRMFIYIDFNGMTRMRVVGLLGTLSVIIGFALVVAKIVQGRGFLWLIRGQMWTGHARRRAVHDPAGRLLRPQLQTPSKSWRAIPRLPRKYPRMKRPSKV